MIILLYIIKQKERKKERKKERRKKKKEERKRKKERRKKERKKEGNTTACHWDSTLKRTSLYLIYPQKCHSCTLRYILVLLGTNVHLYEYKLQRCFIRVLLFTYFTLYFVYVVCTVHGTQ